MDFGGALGGDSVADTCERVPDCVTVRPSRMTNTMLPLSLPPLDFYSEQGKDNDFKNKKDKKIERCSRTPRPGASPRRPGWYVVKEPAPSDDVPRHVKMLRRLVP